MTITPFDKLHILQSLFSLPCGFNYAN